MTDLTPSQFYSNFCPKFELIHSVYSVLPILHLLNYSSVPNRGACTFINFEKKFPPARSYFGLHVYWFWENFPPCTSIFSCTAVLFWSARLLILRKNSPLHGLILVCTFIDFETIFPPAHLFRTARLFGTLEYCNVLYAPPTPPHSGVWLCSRIFNSQFTKFVI